MFVGCQVIDYSYRYLYVNDEVVSQGRSSKSKLLGQTMMHAYPGIEETRAFKSIKLCMNTRKPQRLDSEFTFPAGNKGWFELRIDPIEEGVIIFSVEVTERWQRETELKLQNIALHGARADLERQKLQAEAMLEGLGEAVVAVNEERKIIMVNRVGVAMLGWKEKELLGQDVLNLKLEDVNHHPLKISDRPTYKALQTGEVVSNEKVQGRPLHKAKSIGNIVNELYYLGRKDGTMFPIMGAVNPIKINKKIIGAIITFRDVSEEIESDRVKSEFVSLASHQLRTPLGISKWYLEAILEGKLLEGTPKKLQGMVRKVYENNERVLSLVRDLLSVTRIDQGKVEDTPQIVNLEDILPRIIKEMKVVAVPRRIALSYEIQKGIESICIDVLRFREVIENLMVNGINYNNPGGFVKVSVVRKDGYLIFNVQDNGFGIPNYDKKSLFTKFFRSKKAVLANPGGSGLGLYVAKNYVEGWKGKISFESEIGKGTTFSVTLPSNLIKRSSSE